MIEEGAMHDVAAVFGLHIGAHLAAGRAYVSAGPVMAGSDTFDVTVEGRSAHAARPHEGIDAIVLAAHTVLACQNAVARRLAPADEGVLTIGTVHGGVAENVLAERVVLRGTIRYFEERVRGTLHRELRNAAAVADTLGGRTTIEVRPGYPPVVNHPAATAVAREAIARALGDEAVVEFEPMMGAEDFALLALEAPACFIWLGAALDPPREHHHPRFDIDERMLVHGAAALAACATDALRDPSRIANAS
jgi:amidohydrolase